MRSDSLVRMNNLLLNLLSQRPPPPHPLLASWRLLRLAVEIYLHGKGKELSRKGCIWSMIKWPSNKQQMSTPPSMLIFVVTSWAALYSRCFVERLMLDWCSIAACYTIYLVVHPLYFLLWMQLGDFPWRPETTAECRENTFHAWRMTRLCILPVICEKKALQIAIYIWQTKRQY